VRITKPTYCVWIVAPPGDIHWQCLNEAANGIFFSLAELGHGAYVCSSINPPQVEYDRLIVFNSHVSAALLPEHAIIYNSEQIPPTDSPVSPRWNQYIEKLRKHTVWDYSKTNQERLAARGVKSILCPIGYYPQMERITEDVKQDIDVLFYGSMNARRNKIVNDCDKAGLVTKHLFGIYGEERDAVIARSKIIANVHFYPSPIWEIFRCSYLIGNKKCVVSENEGCDLGLEAIASATTHHVSYSKIVEECKMLASDYALREQTSSMAYRTFKERGQTERVKIALKCSPKFIDEEKRSAVHG
jgi:hypothetical protein